MYVHPGKEIDCTKSRSPQQSANLQAYTYIGLYIGKYLLK